MNTVFLFYLWAIITSYVGDAFEISCCFFLKERKELNVKFLCSDRLPYRNEYILFWNSFYLSQIFVDYLRPLNWYGLEHTNISVCIPIWMVIQTFDLFTYLIWVGQVEQDLKSRLFLCRSMLLSIIFECLRCYKVILFLAMCGLRYLTRAKTLKKPDQHLSVKFFHSSDAG